MSREDEALASSSAEISELSRENQKLVKLMRTKKRYKQARAARRKVEGPEVEVREAVPAKVPAEKVVLKVADLGRNSRCQFRPGKVKRRRSLVESRHNGIVAAPPESYRRRSLCGVAGCARVACCLDAGVASRRLDS